MRGLVEDTKRTKLSSANNNNLSSTSGSSRIKSSSLATGSSASGSSSKPLRSSAKTPTTGSATSVAAGTMAAKKAPQTGQQQVGKSAKSSTSATPIGTTAAATVGTATTKAQAAAAKSQKGQNPPPQQVQPKQQPPQPQQTQQQPLVLQQQQASNSSNTIALPKASHANTSEELAGGVQDTIYLCNFRVSVDGEWLCLKELQDIDVAGGTANQAAQTSEKLAGGSSSQTGFGSNYNVGSSSSKRNSKRFSGLSTGSGSGGNAGGGGALDITDNGIMAIENLIGRRLCDMVHSGSAALGQSQSHSQSQHQSVGLFAEWSHLSRDTAEIERSKSGDHLQAGGQGAVGAVGAIWSHAGLGSPAAAAFLHRHRARPGARIAAQEGSAGTEEGTLGPAAERRALLSGGAGYYGECKGSAHRPYPHWPRSCLAEDRFDAKEAIGLPAGAHRAPGGFTLRLL
ncbi:GM10122 [Drosophila sechellia]|uniref:GM10122 n=1 Tax=Drosophila sechellia TaxID=7238 RepID=B4IC60_DROSE|nr:GM10122 [Drosophila sechellia]